MKVIYNLILIFSLLSGSVANAQVGDVLIYNSDELKCYLHQLNDSLVYMTFEDYSSSSTYYLGQFHFKHDTLIIDEVLDPISIEKDVYYYHNKELGSEKLIIEYFNDDYIQPFAHYTFDTLELEIEGRKYLMLEEGIIVDSYAVEIEKPGSESFSIRLTSDAELVSVIEVELKTDCNHIMIKESSVFSLPGFTTETFEELVPETIDLKGRAYQLQIHLAD